VFFIFEDCSSMIIAVVAVVVVVVVVGLAAPDINDLLT
jgi:hypothetical protein